MTTLGLTTSENSPAHQHLNLSHPVWEMQKWMSEYIPTEIQRDNIHHYKMTVLWVIEGYCS